VLDQLKTDHVVQLALAGVVIVGCLACSMWGLWAGRLLMQGNASAPPPQVAQDPPANTPEPTATPVPVPTATATTIPLALPTASEEQAKARWQTVDIRDLVKNPDRYNEQQVHYEGEVLSIEEADDGTVMQIWVQVPGGSDFDREVVIVVYRGGTDGIYEDTKVEFWGYCKGALEGTNAFGGAIRQPLISADYLTYFY